MPKKYHYPDRLLRDTHYPGVTTQSTLSDNALAMLTVLFISVILTCPTIVIASGQTTREQIGIATQLFETGRFSEAATIIRTLREKPEPPNQIIFLSGALYYQEGNYNSAAAEFRQLLISDPSLLRPRLELARALYKARDYQAASYHFEQALAAPLPEKVSWNVRNFLRDIRERSMRFSFSLDLISDSNPTHSTSSEVINIAGFKYRLNENAKARKSWGVAFTGDAKWPVPSDPTIYGRARLEASKFQDNRLNWSYLQLMGGKHFRFINHTFTAEAGGHTSSYGDKSLYDGLALAVSDHHKLSANTDWVIRYDLKQLNYSDYTYLTSLHHSIAVHWLYADTPVSRWQLGLGMINHDADEQSYSFTSPVLSGRYLYEWPGGLITGISLEYSDLSYDGIDPFFAIKRHDKEKLIELELVNRNWQWQGLAMRFIAGVISHDSNLDLYRFRREYIRLGLTKEF
ncbi:surface lipoprotein assembly modifier [Amphritea sp. HPY]|uniref:surface lipoprotein assembly modifier n=1 Tax=Amphritea sp. HPY TaxID=3421652 RepID=UPI003D7D1BEB